MNKLSFEKLIEHIKSLTLSDAEKTAMRTRLVRYAHHNPVTTPQVFWVKRLALVAFCAVITVGSSGLLASASQSTLPGNFLYPIKRSTESVKKISLGSPEKKIAYELSLIEKRFNEANTLSTEKLMTKETEVMISQAIAQHTDYVKKEIVKVARTDPSGALAYGNMLSHSLKTGGSILLAIADQKNSEVSIPEKSHTPTKLVLAAYQKAETISLDTDKLETLVLLETSQENPEKLKEKADEKYAQAKELLEKELDTQPKEESVPTTVKIDSQETKTELVKVPTKDTQPVTETLPPSSESTLLEKTDLATTVLEKATSKTTSAVDTSQISEPLKTTETTSLEEKVSSESPITADELLPKTLEDLAKELEHAYQEKNYTKTIIVAEKIIQEIATAEKIKSAESTYNIAVIEPLIVSETLKKQD